jgi:hypothetical protein
MWMRTTRLVCISGWLAASACGSSGGTSASPVIAQVPGVWRISSRVTSVTTAECVGATLATSGVVGSTSNLTAQISQSGANLTVVGTDTDTGAVTNYTGTAGASTVALNFQSCTLCAFRVVCSNGAVRDVTSATP